MNIFVTDTCPVRSAQALDNRRLNKMMLESIQLFAYAGVQLGVPVSELPKTKDGNPYKTGGAHRKHPCTLWLMKSSGNATWLYEHFKAMTEEYKFRYGKETSYASNLECISKMALRYWKYGELTEFANCSLWPGISDISLAYRLTMINKWETAKESGNSRKSIKFGKRGEPSWYPFLKQNSNWSR